MWLRSYRTIVKIERVSQTIESMEKGLNSDIEFQQQPYHVQTEDWGMGSPYIVTRVFRHGEVVKSVKRHYSEVIPKSGLRDHANLSGLVQKALENQHQSILDLLVSGHLF